MSVSSICVLLSCGKTPDLGNAACGRERWSVKTGTDPDARSVHSEPRVTSIAVLTGLTAPANPPENARVSPQEQQTFTLRDIQLVSHKLEGDSDFHLVLSDGSRTMIAEIPIPRCVEPTSPFAGQIASARATFEAHFQPTPTRQTVNAIATVTGVGFFDSVHEQVGVAPNGFELHPLLSICVGTGCE